MTVAEERIWRQRQYEHTKKRMASRYSLPLSEETYEQFGQQIKKKEATYCSVHPRNSRFQVWLLEHADTEILIGFDKVHRCVATALPPIAINKFKHLAESLAAVEELSKTYAPPKKQETINWTGKKGPATTKSNHECILEGQLQSCFVCRKKLIAGRMAFDKIEKVFLCQVCINAVASMRGALKNIDQLVSFIRYGKHYDPKNQLDFFAEEVEGNRQEDDRGVATVESEPQCSTAD